MDARLLACARSLSAGHGGPSGHRSRSTFRTTQQIDAAATHMRVDFAGIQYGFASAGISARI